MKGLMSLILSVVSLEAATVAHYRFEDGSMGGPLYVMTDSSGNGHHGRVVGQELFELTSDVPQYAATGGAALDLRGRLDYAVIPHHRDFAPTGDWTIEFFVKVAHRHQEWGGATNIAPPNWSILNTNESYTILAKKNPEAAKGSAWAFHYQPHSGNIVFTLSRNATEILETVWFGADLRDAKWHHLAITSKDGDLRVFLDGFHFMSSAIGRQVAWGEGPIVVGAWARQDSQHMVEDRNFDGMLDEIRFSDAALDAESFVVNFAPLLFPPIPLEAYRAVELAFQAEAGKIYRIEAMDAATGTHSVVGHAEGEGGLKSFYYRSGSRPMEFRIVPDVENPASTVAFARHEAIELRFQTEPQQLYYIAGCREVRCVDERQVFLLGDGAKTSYFERVADGATFYKVERY